MNGVLTNVVTGQHTKASVEQIFEDQENSDLLPHPSDLAKNLTPSTMTLYIGQKDHLPYNVTTTVNNSEVEEGKRVLAAETKTFTLLSTATQKINVPTKLKPLSEAPEEVRDEANDLK